jgi:hypothetical protein
MMNMPEWMAWFIVLGLAFCIFIFGVFIGEIIKLNDVNKQLRERHKKELT